MPQDKNESTFDEFHRIMGSWKEQQRVFGDKVTGEEAIALAILVAADQIVAAINRVAAKPALQKP